MQVHRRVAQTLDARRRRRRLSRLELAIAVIIIGVLIGIITSRVSALMVQVEKTNMTQIEGRLRAALGLAVALRVARGRPAAAARLAGSNPMDLLQTRPANYLGAFP